MLEDFLEQTEFKDYDDFFANYKIKIPANFNFGYDVVDVLAKRTPDAKAFVWCNDNNEELTMTFGELKERTGDMRLKKCWKNLHGRIFLLCLPDFLMLTGFMPPVSAKHFHQSILIGI